MKECAGLRAAVSKRGQSHVYRMTVLGARGPVDWRNECSEEGQNGRSTHNEVVIERRRAELSVRGSQNGRCESVLGGRGGLRRESVSCNEAREEREAEREIRAIREWDECKKQRLQKMGWRAAGWVD